MRRLAVALLALAGVADMAVAQGVQANVGRFYEDEGWTLYRLGVDRPLTGPLSTTVHGDYLRRVGDADGAFAGLGLDVTAFRGGGPYLVAGLAAGMGSPHSQSFSSTWTSWSAGEATSWCRRPSCALASRRDGARSRWTGARGWSSPQAFRSTWAAAADRLRRRPRAARRAARPKREAM